MKMRLYKRVLGLPQANAIKHTSNGVDRLSAILIKGFLLGRASGRPLYPEAKMFNNMAY